MEDASCNDLISKSHLLLVLLMVNPIHDLLHCDIVVHREILGYVQERVLLLDVSHSQIKRVGYGRNRCSSDISIS